MKGEGKRVLIIGGYGTFGGRLARLLGDEPGLTLIIAARSHAAAARFCARLPGGAGREPRAFDRDGDVAAQLTASAADLVVDASGPFQAYGEAPYRVIEAALALGIPYLDLADATDFVAGIARFDATAQARGVFALAGVSTFPVLSAAVLAELARDMARLYGAAGGIAPSPHAGLGRNVIAAIAAYAGRRVATGRERDGRALIAARRYTIARPGELPLANTLFSLIAVPDTKILPTLWPELRSAWFGVGPRPEILHRMLGAMAWLVRLRCLPSLAPFARLFHRAVARLRWGPHRGGMFMALSGGRQDGAAIERSWHLIAEGDDGPFIPAMAAAILVRRCLAGRPPAPGARLAIGEITLADYEQEFARRAIRTGRREATPETCAAPLYRRLLGDAWHRLPEPLRAMHGGSAGRSASGLATIERGRGWIARIVAALFGFPPAGSEVPVRVDIGKRGSGEVWRRDFAGHRFASVQSAGTARWQYLLAERFGPFSFALALVVSDGRLRLVPRHWRCLGLPLPLALAPGGEAFEHAEDGRFHFDVTIGHPLTGLIVRYRGWLVPEVRTATAAPKKSMRRA